MTARARQELARGCQLVIFPEGTRRPPGAEPIYKPGIAFLYSQTNVPCVPIALNSGLFWPRRSLRRRPGTILVEVLLPIPPGLDRKVFFARLQNVMEEATAKLIQESEQRSGPGTG
jgi:1-acyl-sn-glycerol-3-phosphate acyltransferase